MADEDVKVWPLVWTWCGDYNRCTMNVNAWSPSKLFFLKKQLYNCISSKETVDCGQGYKKSNNTKLCNDESGSWFSRKLPQRVRINKEDDIIGEINPSGFKFNMSVCLSIAWSDVFKTMMKKVFKIFTQSKWQENEGKGRGCEEKKVIGLLKNTWIL